MNERINQLEALLQEAHREPISEVAPVVQFDGIWLNLQTQQEGFKEDSRKRKRHQKQGKRMVVLVALGLWADGSGKRHILDGLSSHECIRGTSQAHRIRGTLARNTVTGGCHL